ncbi:MAG: hypothetical protein HQL37_12040 [Alphaproteobacteria bacterium]|nr:hypothetical protein [Alphaproteobacteria bacterium]
MILSPIKPVFFLVLLASLVLVSGLLMFSLITNGHDWGGDFSGYIMQAKSLVEGDTDAFVQRNRFTIENTGPGLGPIAYPWGFPLILAPIYALYGLDLPALKMAGLLSYACFLLVLYFGFANTCSKAWLFVFVVFFAFNPTMIEFVNHIMSDLPFLLFSTIAMALIGTVLIERRPIISPFIDHVLIGVAIGMACLVRTNGLLLVAVLAGVQILQAVGGRRTLNCIVPHAVFLVTNLLEHALLPEGGDSYFSFRNSATYLMLLNSLTADNIYSNAAYNFNMIITFIDTRIEALPLFSAVPPALAAIGATKSIRRTYHWLGYIALTFLLYSIWPWRQGIRFLFPLLPFYVLLIIIGLESIADGIVRHTRQPMLGLLLFASAFVWDLSQAHRSLLALDALTNSRETQDGPFGDGATRLFSFIKSESQPDDILIFRKPRVIALLTGRRAFRTRNTAEFGKGSILVIDRNFDDQWFNAIPESSKSLLHTIYDDGRFIVFRLQ